MSGFAGKDATFAIGLGATGATATVAQIRDMDGLGMSAESIDVSHRDSTSAWTERLGGWKDGGDITFDLVFDAAGATGHSELPDYVGELCNYAIGLGDTSTITGTCVVTGCGFKNPYKDAVTADLSIQAANKPTFTAAT